MVVVQLFVGSRATRVGSKAPPGPAPLTGRADEISATDGGTSQGYLFASKGVLSGPQMATLSRGV
jgi:hypothetical protein